MLWWAFRMRVAAFGFAPDTFFHLGEPMASSCEILSNLFVEPLSPTFVRTGEMP